MTSTYDLSSCKIKDQLKTQVVFHKTETEIFYSAEEKAEMLNSIKEEEKKLLEIKRQKAELIMKQNLSSKKHNDLSLNTTIKSIKSSHNRAKEFSKDVVKKSIVSKKKEPADDVSSLKSEMPIFSEAEPKELTVISEETSVRVVPKTKSTTDLRSQVKEAIESHRSNFRRVTPCLEDVLKFRKFRIVEETESTPTQSVQIIEDNPKEAEEKRKYHKAIRNFLIDKEGERDIVLPNLCSCGRLQTNLRKLMECRNVNLVMPTVPDCANNCIYYGNPKEYNKALKDILRSVTALKTDNFI